MKRGMRAPLIGSQTNLSSTNTKENVQTAPGERRYIQRVDTQWKDHETSLELLKGSQPKELGRRTCEHSCEGNAPLQQRRTNVMSRSLRADSPLKQIFGGRNHQMYESQHLTSHRTKGDAFEHSDQKLRYITCKGSHQPMEYYGSNMKGSTCLSQSSLDLKDIRTVQYDSNLININYNSIMVEKDKDSYRGSTPSKIIIESRHIPSTFDHSGKPG